MNSPTATTYEHIHLDDDGVAFIAGTTMKVIELVLAQRAHGWSPEELHFQYPYLTMSQIHSALAYYWEHKSVLDADIARRAEYVDQMRADSDSTPFASRMRDQGYRE